MPDDQTDIESFQEHFVLTMKSLQEALKCGAPSFYNHVLDGLETIAEMTQALENGKLELEEFVQVQIIPLEEIKKLDRVARWKAEENIVNACAVCSSTDIRPVTIIENCTDGGGDFINHIDGYRCNECGYTFEIDFYIHNDVKPRLSENSD